MELSAYVLSSDFEINGKGDIDLRIEGADRFAIET